MKNDRNPRKRTSLLIELLLLLAILAIAASQMITLEDLSIADEAGYMRGGLELSPSSYTYSYLYALGGLLSSDLVVAHFVGRALGVIVFVLGVWVAGRLLVSPVAALTGALVLTALGSPYVWPGIATFAAGINIAAAAILLKYRDVRWLTLATVLLWIGAASRPEYWPAAALASIIAVWMIRTDVSRRCIPLHVAVAALAVLITVPTFLIAGGAVELGGQRTLVAFGQHYAVAKGGDAYWVGWEDVLARDFGNVSSAGEAFWAAPDVFAAHVGRNLPRVAPMLRDSLLWGRNTRPGLALSNSVALATLAGLIAFGAAVAMRRLLHEGASVARERVFALHRWPVYALALLSVPPVLILFPRLHYMQMWIAASVLASVVAMGALSARLRIAIALTAASLIGIPLAVSVVHSHAQPSYRENLELVRALQTLPGDHVVATTLSPELSTYIPNVAMVSPQPTDDTFEDFLRREEVDVIVADSGLLAGGWSDVPGFVEFDPAASGFELVITEPRNVFLRETALR